MLCCRKDNNITVVLFWKPPFEVLSLNENLAPNCIMTYDQSSVDVADAVVFHFREISDRPRSLPLKNRNPNQM